MKRYLDISSLARAADVPRSSARDRIAKSGLTPDAEIVLVSAGVKTLRPIYAEDRLDEIVAVLLPKPTVPVQPGEAS